MGFPRWRPCGFRWSRMSSAKTWTPSTRPRASRPCWRRGAKLEDIAVQTGLHLSAIKRRLALDTLSDDVKGAVRAGEVGLAIAEALKLGGHDEQAAFLEALASGDAWTDAADLRAYVTADRPTVALAAFDVSEYGGTFTTDLFGAAETTYFDDAEQFHQLQREAVRRIAAGAGRMSPRGRFGRSTSSAHLLASSQPNERLADSTTFGRTRAHREPELSFNAASFVCAPCAPSRRRMAERRIPACTPLHLTH